MAKKAAIFTIRMTCSFLSKYIYFPPKVVQGGEALKAKEHVGMKFQPYS